ncbi:MAG: hypothetical protein IKA72_01755 [Clostridia bacterium]|nr:hypothetical protein [Clostridia bacterium]
MESFGLFDLLKSMLLFKGDNQSSSVDPPHPPSSENTAETFSNKLSPQSKAVDSSPPPNLNQSNACVEFLQRHDERAKRHRK